MEITITDNVKEMQEALVDAGYGEVAAARAAKTLRGVDPSKDWHVTDTGEVISPTEYEHRNNVL